MSYTLETFSKAAREILLKDSGRTGREQVGKLLEEVVNDKNFVQQHLGDDQPQRRVLYQDPDLGFAILGHVFKEARKAPPHDHGKSWAIYAQAQGNTTMINWDVLESANGEVAGKIKQRDSIKLKPGNVRVYHEGEVHSLSRDSAAKLIRIEGQPDQPPTGRKWEIV